MNSLLSEDEVKQLLELQEKELSDLIDRGRLQAYKIGGAYMRFRKDDVLTLKQEIHSKKKTGPSVSWFSKTANFWKFNNFYILSILLIGVLIYFVIRS